MRPPADCESRKQRERRGRDHLRRDEQSPLERAHERDRVADSGGRIDAPPSLHALVRPAAPRAARPLP